MCEARASVRTWIHSAAWRSFPRLEGGPHRGQTRGTTRYHVIIMLRAVSTCVGEPCTNVVAADSTTAAQPTSHARRVALRGRSSRVLFADGATAASRFRPKGLPRGFQEATAGCPK